MNEQSNGQLGNEHSRTKKKKKEFIPLYIFFGNDSMLHVACLLCSPCEINKSLSQPNVAHLCIDRHGFACHIVEQLLMLGLICRTKVRVVDTKVAQRRWGHGRSCIG